MAAAGADTPFEGANRRRWARYRLDAHIAAVLVTDEDKMACVIENISLAGAKLGLPADGAPALHRGGELRLVPAAGPSLDGKAAWCGPRSLGVAFAYSDPSVELTLACLTAPGVSEKS